MSIRRGASSGERDRDDDSSPESLYFYKFEFIRSRMQLVIRILKSYLFLIYRSN